MCARKSLLHDLQSDCLFYSHCDTLAITSRLLVECFHYLLFKELQDYTSHSFSSSIKNKTSKIAFFHFYFSLPWVWYCSFKFQSNSTSWSPHFFLLLLHFLFCHISVFMFVFTLFVSSLFFHSHRIICFRCCFSSCLLFRLFLSSSCLRSATTTAADSETTTTKSSASTVVVSVTEQQPPTLCRQCCGSHYIYRLFLVVASTPAANAATYVTYSIASYATAIVVAFFVLWFDYHRSPPPPPRPRPPPPPNPYPPRPPPRPPPPPR